MTNDEKTAWCGLGFGGPSLVIRHCRLIRHSGLGIRHCRACPLHGVAARNLNRKAGGDVTSFLCPLASGSLGNALLVASGRTRVLVDIGLTQRRLKEALAAVGVEPGEIDAVFVTHTHRDHFSTSAAGFCLRHTIPVYASRENLAHLSDTLPGFRKLVRGGLARPMDGEAVEIGNVAVEAFDVPHDSPGWCQGFRLSLGPSRRRRSVAVATDLGHVPDDVLAWFIDATAV
jgi:phosphoribosyl 1,2-cyclic phosphodiesterase